MSVHSEATLNRKFMEFIKLLNVYLNHFPKHEKYGLSNRMRDTAYGLYDLITEAQKRYHKKTTLTNMDITHQKLRMQLYLAYELGYFRFKDGKTYIDSPGRSLEEHRFMAISRLNDEMGRMIGGWVNKMKETERC